MGDWTSEPWEVSEGEHNLSSCADITAASIHSADGEWIIAQVWDDIEVGVGEDAYSRPGKANAERIVACINACAGIKDPSVVKELVEFARKCKKHDLYEDHVTGRLDSIMEKLEKV
jgi:hypothetical protein